MILKKNLRKFLVCSSHFAFIYIESFDCSEMRKTYDIACKYPNLQSQGHIKVMFKKCINRVYICNFSNIVGRHRKAEKENLYVNCFSFPQTFQNSVQLNIDNSKIN